MARARELRPQTRTQLDALRDNLTELERSLPTLRGMGPRAVELLHRLDAVYDDMARLREQGIDLRPEQTRLDSVEEQLRGKRAPVLVKEIARSVGWKEARASVAPGRERWWWYLDEELAQQRRAKLQRWLVRGGIILLVLALLAGAYKRFLAPSPAMEQKITLVQNAERDYERGELDQAIAKYEQAAAIDPNDPEVQVWLGALYGQAGEREAAIKAFQSAREVSPSIINYFLLRARIHLRMGMLRESERDVLAALEIDPHSTQALFLLADVLERQGHYGEAMAVFHKVSLEAQEPALQVLAKVRYGMLLQAGPSMEIRTITPTVEQGGE